MWEIMDDIMRSLIQEMSRYQRINNISTKPRRSAMQTLVQHFQRVCLKISGSVSPRLSVFFILDAV
jgi:hypothetical protein